MPTLISMTADEAVVAEQVTTYKRAQIEAELEQLRAQVAADTASISTLEHQLLEARARIDANEYKLELYQALKDAFDRDYPRSSIVAGSDTSLLQKIAPTFTAPVADSIEHINPAPLSEE